MMDKLEVDLVVCVIVLLVILIVVVIIWRAVKNVRRKLTSVAAQQEVPNISSSVNGISTDSLTRQQPPGSPPLPYSSIVLGDKDMRPGFDDPPPSYEQAMNSLQTQRIDSEVRINVTDLPATSSEVHVPVHRPEVTS